MRTRGRLLHRRRRPRLVLLGAFILAAAPIAVVLLAGWRDVASARADLSVARASVAQVERAELVETPSGRSELVGQLDAAARAVAAARARSVQSRPLSLLGALPFGRAIRSQVVALTADAGQAVRVARELVVAVDAGVADAQLRDGRLPMASLADLQASVARASRALAPLAQGSSVGWTPITPYRRRFDRSVSALAERLARVADGLEATKSFAGATADRRYFLAFANNAEMRDGGAILSYGVVDFANGRFTLAHTGSVSELTLDAPAPTEVPDATAAAFGSLHPTQTWQSVNATADFALSGRAMADMYRQATGAEVHGVISVDVPGLAALLTVVGPVTTVGIPEPVAADNVSRVLLHDQYQGIPPLVDASDRRDRLAEVTRTIVERLREGAYDPIYLGRVLAGASRGRHLRLWSADAAEERYFESSGLGGSPGLVAPERTFHLAVENRTATKLDYFVRPAVSQQVRITDGGDAVVSTTVRLENRSPAGAAPSYQLGPDKFTEAPGDYLGWVLLWGPGEGSEGASARRESGLALSERVVLVKSGDAIDVALPPTTIKRAVRNGRLDLRLVPQPRLEPADLHVTVIGGKWRVSGPPEFRGPWDRTLSLSWKVRR